MTQKIWKKIVIPAAVGILVLIAMLFYPGAKVEYTAYLPFVHKMAEEGKDCFLVKMPCNLVFLGQNKAEKIMDSYDYEYWYLSGHSLGGAMAAIF